MHKKYWKYRLAAGLLAGLLATTAAVEAAEITTAAVSTEAAAEADTSAAETAAATEADTSAAETAAVTEADTSAATTAAVTEADTSAAMTAATEADTSTAATAAATEADTSTATTAATEADTSAAAAGTSEADTGAAETEAAEADTSAAETAATEADTNAETTAADTTEAETTVTEADATEADTTPEPEISEPETTVESTTETVTEPSQTSEEETAGYRELMECDAKGYAWDATNVYMEANAQASPVCVMPADTMMFVRAAILEDGEICWYRVMFAMNDIGYEGYVRPDTVDITDNGVSMFDLSGDVDQTEQFPEDYQVLIKALKEKYPNWVFQPLYTNLDFKYAVDEEQSLVNRNLVHISQIMDWKSFKSVGKDKNGEMYNYNWQTDTWYEWEPKIVAASDESVAYCMDPRNFINEQSVFMFEDLSYHGEFQTEESVNALLKGTFMYDTNVPGEEFTYAWLLHWVGKRYGINPVMLASRLRQEQGIYGTSELISGTYPGYESLYNHYNTVASGKTREEIIRTGLDAARKGSSMMLPGPAGEDGQPTEVAYSGPWDTPTRSIIGGCLYIATTYILIGQDSLYLQKFDVDDSDNRLFWHQYMQNVQAPISESKTVKMSYTNMNLLDQPFVFTIPVFDNMPESTPAPTSDLNPNNCLNRLAVNGQRVFSDFDKDVSEFKIEVGYNTTTARISITTASSRATVSEVPNMQLEVGDNICTFEVTAETGDKRTYTLNVVRLQEGVEVPEIPAEDAELAYGEFLVEGTKVYIGLENDQKGSVYIPYYNMNVSEDGKVLRIDGVSAGTDAQSFLKNIDVKGNIWAGLYYGDDFDERKGTDPAGTGTYLVISDHGTGKIVLCCPIIIYGDTNGDGLYNVIDFSIAKAHLLGRYDMTEDQEFANDLNGDGVFNIIDFSLLKANLLGRYEIVQKKTE